MEIPVPLREKKRIAKLDGRFAHHDSFYYIRKCNGMQVFPMDSGMEKNYFGKI